jgi:hypothetical protein
LLFFFWLSPSSAESELLLLLDSSDSDDETQTVSMCRFFDDAPSLVVGEALVDAAALAGGLLRSS